MSLGKKNGPAIYGSIFRRGLYPGTIHKISVNVFFVSYFDHGPVMRIKSAYNPFNAVVGSEVGRHFKFFKTFLEHIRRVSNVIGFYVIIYSALKVPSRWHTLNQSPSLDSRFLSCTIFTLKNQALIFGPFWRLRRRVFP